jgi:hypothetical protein
MEKCDMTWDTIVTAVISSGVASGLFAALSAGWLDRRLERLKDELERDRNVHSQVWQMKRDACLHALNVANAVLSNYEYENVPNDKIVPQFEDIRSVRACFNELATTCDSREVLDQLKRVITKPVKPDVIVDVRNAVRRELGFKNAEIDTDRENAFVAKVNCHRRNKRTRVAAAR